MSMQSSRGNSYTPNLSVDCSRYRHQGGAWGGRGGWNCGGKCKWSLPAWMCCQEGQACQLTNDKANQARQDQGSQKSSKIHHLGASHLKQDDRRAKLLAWHSGQSQSPADTLSKLKSAERTPQQTYGTGSDTSSQQLTRLQLES